MLLEDKGLSKESKIYVVGHNGLVDSAIWNNCGYTNLVGCSHKELDLTDQVVVKGLCRFSCNDLL